jgi:hypothetical protein
MLYEQLIEFESSDGYGKLLNWEWSHALYPVRLWYQPLCVYVLISSALMFLLAVMYSICIVVDLLNVTAQCQIVSFQSIVFYAPYIYSNHLITWILAKSACCSLCSSKPFRDIALKY